MLVRGICFVRISCDPGAEFSEQTTPEAEVEESGEEKETAAGMSTGSPFHKLHALPKAASASCWGVGAKHRPVE